MLIYLLISRSLPVFLQEFIQTIEGLIVLLLYVVFFVAVFLLLVINCLLHPIAAILLYLLFILVSKVVPAITQWLIYEKDGVTKKSLKKGIFDLGVVIKNICVFIFFCGVCLAAYHKITGESEQSPPNESIDSSQNTPAQLSEDQGSVSKTTALN